MGLHTPCWALPRGFVFVVNSFRRHRNTIPHAEGNYCTAVFCTVCVCCGYFFILLKKKIPAASYCSKLLAPSRYLLILCRYVLRWKRHVISDLDSSPASGSIRELHSGSLMDAKTESRDFVSLQVSPEVSPTTTLSLQKRGWLLQ